LPAEIEADFALNLALPLAHKTNQPAKDIAEKIFSLTKDSQYLQGEITPQGYINFRLNDEYYYRFIKKIIAQRKKLSIKKTVLIEHTSVNPTGQLHLGNARIAVIGDTLANVYQFLGYQVIREYYINDRGGQIASLVNSIYYFYHQLQGLSPSTEPEKIEYTGKASQEIAQELIKK